MKIIQGRADHAPSEPRTGTFTGDVWGDPIFAEAEDVTINSVFFAPAGRTHWHHHNGAQILCAVAGRGLAFTRSGVGGEIKAGDIVDIPAGEEHWHGADSDTFLLHTAITFGGHEWLDPVTDEEYAARESRPGAST